MRIFKLRQTIVKLVLRRKSMWGCQTIARRGSDWICSASVAISVSRRSAPNRCPSAVADRRYSVLEFLCAELVLSAVIDAPLQGNGALRRG
jgi:hypothetical protein